MGAQVLGRASCFDQAAEEANISESTLQRFFHSFCNVLAKAFDEQCGPPGTEEALKAAMDE